jgi:hypothetical protein
MFRVKYICRELYQDEPSGTLTAMAPRLGLLRGALREFRLPLMIVGRGGLRSFCTRRLYPCDPTYDTFNTVFRATSRCIPKLYCTTNGVVPGLYSKASPIVWIGAVMP